MIFNVSYTDVENNRPIIEGVDLSKTKYLGEHEKVQEWDFIEWDGMTALYVPLRYAILTGYRLMGIYLSFASER